MSIPDNYDQWLKHDKRQTDWLNSRPRCDWCGQRIQDEKLMDIEGVLYHVDCVVEQFEKDTEDYVT